MKEVLKPIAWKLTDSTKPIGPYTCKRAEAFIRGRKYEAWYTPDIPISDGPWKLYGLPGLILSAQDATGQVHFSITTLEHPYESVTPKRFVLPKGRAFISEEGYLAILKKDLTNFMMVFHGNNTESKAQPIKGTTSTVTIQPTGIEILPVISAEIKN